MSSDGPDGFGISGTFQTSPETDEVIGCHTGTRWPGKAYSIHHSPVALFQRVLRALSKLRERFVPPRKECVSR